MGLLHLPSLRPINSWKGLPVLVKPNSRLNGKVERKGKYTHFQYSPSDHPKFTTWNGKPPNYKDYSDEEMLYTVNSHYFRADEFDRNNPGLMSLGCSHTFGTGLRDTENWPYMLSKELKLPNWNLGCGSMGPDYCHYVAKQFFEEGYIPKIVCIMWPSIYRKILIREKSEIDQSISAFLLEGKQKTDEIALPYLPGTEHEDTDFKQLIKSMHLLNFEENFVRFWNHRESLIALCKMHQVPYVEMLPEDDCGVIKNLTNVCKTMPPRTSFTIVGRTTIDENLFAKNPARDGLHYGPHISKIIASEFLRVIESDKLCPTRVLDSNV